MLAHFGPETGFVLPNSKFDGDPALRRGVERIKKQLRIDAAIEATESGTPQDVERCTPLGRDSVELILSALRVFGEEQFSRLPRTDRHHVVASMMQHTQGLRFGHFIYRNYSRAAFFEDPNGSLFMMSDWHRYPSARRFCLEFETNPAFDCQRYRVFRSDGSVATTLTTCDVLHWHFGQLRAAGEASIFAPVISARVSRDERQSWLRTTLLRALPLYEVAARRLVGFVSPHSFRAGLAGDLFRAGASISRIGSICRWNSTKAIRIYAERSPLARSRRSRSFRVISRKG